MKKRVISRVKVSKHLSSKAEFMGVGLLDIIISSTITFIAMKNVSDINSKLITILIVQIPLLIMLATFRRIAPKAYYKKLFYRYVKND